MTQLRLYKRYVMEADHGAPYQFSSLLGYWFPDEQPSDSPKIGMQIAVEPKAAQHPAIVKAMHKFSEGSKRPRKWDWHPAGGDDWEEIQCTRKLEDFLAEEDHVAAIRKWFEELLDDAAAFRKQNPKLPWSVRAAEGEDK